MIDLSALKEKTGGKAIAVMGLGKSGLAAIAACVKAGIPVVAWDDKPSSREKAAAAGAQVENLALADYKGIYALALSPGVPGTNPAALAAANAGVPAVCDIELLHRGRPGIATVGITGTNGKSTTTALIAHILKGAGRSAEAGGNIGLPVLAMDEPDVFVLELSSFQLDLCPDFAPGVAVLLNISPDHLDRHGSMEAYMAAKERIFRGTGTAVVCVDDDFSRAVAARVAKEGKRSVVTVSAHDRAAAVHADARGVLCADGKKVCNLSKIESLRGIHNRQNAAAAFAACRALGLGGDEIARGLESFPGLAHRQMTVRRIGRVAYINDSKATNDQAAAVALAAHDNVFWIAGGKPKGGGWPLSATHLAHVRHAFLIGAAAQKMAAWLAAQKIPHTACETLDRAVPEAHAQAQGSGADACVLLSPACASFDQFENFERRGEAFERLVNALPAGNECKPCKEMHA